MRSSGCWNKGTASKRQLQGAAHLDCRALRAQNSLHKVPKVVSAPASALTAFDCYTNLSSGSERMVIALILG